MQLPKAKTHHSTSSWYGTLVGENTHIIWNGLIHGMAGHPAKETTRGERMTLSRSLPQTGSKHRNRTEKRHHYRPRHNDSRCQKREFRQGTHLYNQYLQPESPR